MMEIRWFSNKESCDFLGTLVSRQIWPDRDLQLFGECVCMGVFDGIVPAAVMIYHNYEPNHGVMEISGAAISSRWLTRKSLNAMFAYPFYRAGCQMVVMRVSEHNKALERMLMAVGFEAHTIPRLRGRNEAEIIYTLTDDAWNSCRLNKERNHGEAQNSEAA